MFLALQFKLFVLFFPFLPYLGHLFQIGYQVLAILYSRNAFLFITYYILGTERRMK